MKLNVSRLESICSESKASFCSFDVTNDLNFEKNAWLREDESTIENIEWSSDVYPITNNRLSIEVFE